MAANRLVAAAFLILVVMAGSGLWLVLRDDGDSGSTGPTADERPGPKIYANSDAACAAFLSGRERGSVTEAVGKADASQLGERLVTMSGDVVSVGLSLCGDGFVIHIWVTHEAASVPETGPRGTPVLAHLQDEYYGGGG